MKKIAFTVCSTLFITIAFTQSTGNIKLAKGQKFLVDSKVNSVTTQTLMGQSIQSTAELTANYSIEVKDVKDNGYNLNNTFTKIKAKLSAMGNDMNFDSDKKEDIEGEYASSFKDILNKSKEVIIDRSGKIINSKPAETKPADAQPDIMKMMIDQLMGDPDETGYGVDLTFSSSPSKIIAGYTWTDSINKDGIEKIITYTVKEIKGNDASITITGTLNANAKSQMQGIDILNKSKGNLKGEEILDITTGVIKERATTLESKGSTAIESQGLEIPMTTKITFISSVKPA